MSEINKYQRGKIYKIVCNITGLIYVGSTTEKHLSHRLGKHKAYYKNWLDGKCTMTTSYKILENNDYNIILLELVPCNSKDELQKRERYYIETLNCVNKYIPGRTSKQRYEDNKERISEKYKEKYTCECGSCFRKADKSRHEKTIKHKLYIEQQI